MKKSNQTTLDAKLFIESNFSHLKVRVHHRYDGEDLRNGLTLRSVELGLCEVTLSKWPKQIQCRVGPLNGVAKMILKNLASYAGGTKIKPKMRYIDETVKPNIEIMDEFAFHGSGGIKNHDSRKSKRCNSSMWSNP